MMAFTASTSKEKIDSWLDSCKVRDLSYDMYLNEPNVGVVTAYHALWEYWSPFGGGDLTDVMVYIHDDVTIHDASWSNVIEAEFKAYPKTAIVGLGGATGIGTPEIYKKPYGIWQLVRSGYASNQTDWQVHGTQETGSRKVAVVDGFFMAISGEFLEEVQGWSWIQSNFHCYDTAMCLEAIRRGWEVRMVGVNCTHHGGGTSTKQAYADFCHEQGITPEEDHARPHRWLYERYRDILPVRVDK